MWRGRSEAESFDGDENEPIIDDVMVRISLAPGIAPLERIGAVYLGLELPPDDSGGKLSQDH